MTEKNKGGRPKKIIDYVTVEKLASMQCTQEEIASFLNLSVRTLQRDKEFCRIYEKGRETGKMSLRRLQFKLAERSSSMAIFLGKQYLGQKDVVENTEMKDFNENIINIAKLINKPQQNRTESDFDE